MKKLRKVLSSVLLALVFLIAIQCPPEDRPPVAPEAPGLLAGNTQIEVSWAAVNKATAYAVYYNTTNSSVAAVQFGSDVEGTSATITGLTNGTLYYVWLKAKNAGGSSPFSPPSSATPMLSAPMTPAAPTLSPGNAQIGVSWAAVSGATAYAVYHSTTNDSGTAVQFGSDVASTSATITGLTNGTLYYVWLKAKNASGSSPFSPPSSATPMPPAPAAPAAPTLSPGNTQIGVSWAAVSGATAYAMYHNTTNSSVTAVQFGGDVAGTSATITDLTNGTLYYVWLKAKNAGGSSPFSPPSSATPHPCYAALGGGGVTVSQFNGTYIYTIVSPQPAAKPEGDGTPTTYAYSLATVSGSMAAPQRAAREAVGSVPSQSRTLPYGAKQMDADLRMREAEERALSSGALQLSKKVSGIDAAAPYPISVGTTWNNVYIVWTGATISTTCRFISDHAYFFVDNRNIAAMNSYLAGYGTAFDAIYDVNHVKFGTENDTDGNGKVIIVFSQELTGGILGYFYSVDKYPKSYSSDSNEGDIFYITTDAGYQGNTVNGTLAHEFQHMIYFDEHYNQGVTSTYSWLNEALSQAAEFYNSYVSNHLGWIYSFLYSGWSSGLSLTYWTSSNYGYGAIYIRYLIDQYGDAAIKNMCATNKVGVAAVEGATGDDFNTIFNDFTRALVMSGTGDSADPKYNFATLNLQSVQPYGRGGLRITTSYGAGATASGSLYPYSLAAAGWTGSFGTMTLTGTNSAGTAFGLTK